MNYKLPENGIKNNFQKREIITSGFHYQPIRGVSVKLDFVWQKTGKPNSVLYPGNMYSSNFHPENNFYFDIRMFYKWYIRSKYL